MKIKLFKEKYIQKQLKLPSLYLEFVKNRDWAKLDQKIMFDLQADGHLYNELSNYIKIEKIEHIISIRNGEDDEDGIWHDDGSRELAFSVSLNLNEKMKGGFLSYREKGQESVDEIQTPKYGVLTLFKTGQSGFEHKTNRVINGERIIIAGWIN